MISRHTWALYNSSWCSEDSSSQLWASLLEVLHGLPNRSPGTLSQQYVVTLLPLQTRTQAGKLSLSFLAEKGQVTFTSPFTSERIS